MQMQHKSLSAAEGVSAGYEMTARILEITFPANKRFRYVGVPVRVYTAMMQARRPLDYFHKHIRDRYQYQRLE